jgi:hypothetical protein
MPSCRTFAAVATNWQSRRRRTSEWRSPSTNSPWQSDPEARPRVSACRRLAQRNRPPGGIALRPRGATPAVRRPSPPSSLPPAQATGAPGTTGDRAVAGSCSDHRGPRIPPTNSQLSNHDRFSGTHRGAEPASRRGSVQRNCETASRACASSVLTDSDHQERCRTLVSPSLVACSPAPLPRRQRGVAARLPGAHARRGTGHVAGPPGGWLPDVDLPFDRRGEQDCQA